MYLSPTCFPEFSVSENWHDDQQVAQHVYHYSGDEHAGQQSVRPGEGETHIVSTGGRGVPERGCSLIHHPHFMLRETGRQHVPQPCAPLAHSGWARGTAQHRPGTARASLCSIKRTRRRICNSPAALKPWSLRACHLTTGTKFIQRGLCADGTSSQRSLHLLQIQEEFPSISQIYANIIAIVFKGCQVPPLQFV